MCWHHVLLRYLADADVSALDGVPGITCLNGSIQKHLNIYYSLQTDRPISGQTCLVPYYRIV